MAANSARAVGFGGPRRASVRGGGAVKHGAGRFACHRKLPDHATRGPAVRPLVADRARQVPDRVRTAQPPQLRQDRSLGVRPRPAGGGRPRGRAVPDLGVAPCPRASPHVERLDRRRSASRRSGACGGSAPAQPLEVVLVLVKHLARAARRPLLWTLSESAITGRRGAAGFRTAVLDAPTAASGRSSCPLVATRVPRCPRAPAPEQTTGKREPIGANIGWRCEDTRCAKEEDRAAFELRRRRELAGLSQGELAAAAGVARSRSAGSRAAPAACPARPAGWRRRWAAGSRTWWRPRRALRPLRGAAGRPRVPARVPGVRRRAGGGGGSGAGPDRSRHSGQCVGQRQDAADRCLELASGGDDVVASAEIASA
jgi:hypothetical protein